MIASAGARFSCSGIRRGLFGRAFATRASSLRAKGTAAPSTGLAVGARTPALRLTGLLVLAATAYLALTAAPALALESHFLTNSFGSRGSGDGQLELAQHSGLAVNDETGDVYVADTGNRRVVEFSAAGAFIRAFGLDVGGPGVDVCTSGCAKGASASTPGAFKAPALIAVDNSGGASQGDVYVGDTATKLVQKFAPDGTLVSSWAAAGQLDGSTATSPPGALPGPFGALNGIAVEAGGDLLVAGTEPEGENHQLIFRFAPDASFLTDFRTEFGSFVNGGGEPLGIAVDSTGDIYTVRGSGVTAKLDPAGATLNPEVDGQRFALGLAVDPADDDLYVSRDSELFQASEVARYDAAGNSLELFPAAGGAIAIAGPTDPHRVYLTSQGNDTVRAFDLLTLPDAETGAASEVADQTAKLTGTVNPAGTEASYQFEYLTDSRFNARPLVLTGATGGTFTLTFETDRTIPQTTAPIAFDATAAQVQAALEALPEIGAGNVAVTGPAGGPYTIEFEGPLGHVGTPLLNVDRSALTPQPGAEAVLGNASGYSGASVSPASPAAVGNDNAPHEESAELSGLQPSTTYHFRIDGINSQGTNPGADATFHTTGPPEIGPTSASGISGIAATIEAQLNPSGFDTTYKIEYGTSESYGSETGETDIGAANEAQPTINELTGLQPSTTYHYRVLAENSQSPLGGTPGPDHQFTTEPAAQIKEPSLSGLSPSCATLQAQVNPDGSETEVFFEYGETSSYGQSTAPVAIGSANEFQTAGAEVCGLTFGTEYHFRAVATNPVAPAGGVKGPDSSFETLPPVSIDSESASQVTATSALLEAELSANGLPSEYRFEYGLTAAYGQSTPVPDGNAGSAGPEVVVTRSALLQGLQPGTNYHYRLAAHNSLGPVVGPDREFTTQGAAASLLPDGRGWELVSPPDKNGAPLEALGGVEGSGSAIQAAADGSGLAYVSIGPVDAEPPGNRAITDTQLLAHRSASGWSTQDIATPHKNPVGVTVGHLSEYLFFTPDLSLAAVEPAGATPLSPETTERTPYLRRPGGEYTPLLTAANVAPEVKFGGEEKAPEAFVGGVEFVSATPDLSHLVLQSRQALTPGFESGRRNSLYEWHAGALGLLSQVPAAPATVCGGSGPACLPAAEAGLDSSLGNRGRQVRHAISADASRFFFETTNQNGNAHLYLRDAARGETLRLDVAQGVAEPEFSGATFQLASADGSRVFFTDASRLTAGSTAAPGKPDLYMCRIEVTAGHLACALTDLSANALESAEPAAVQGDVIGASEDGSTLYFVADGALAPGAVQGDCELNAPRRQGNICNLYRLDTATGAVALVAVISEVDSPDWGLSTHSADPQLSNLSARVSPDGRYLAFMSSRPLTGYDNRDAKTGEPDEEVFLYDSAAAPGAALRCASCNPSGARPLGAPDQAAFPGLLVDRPGIWANQRLAASIPGWTPVAESFALYQPRYLSNQGRLFFNAADALVPQDSNGTFDVYTYEPPQGEGAPPADSCTTASPTYSPRSGGCVSLISSGASGEESAFLDASETGSDVFFLTSSRLAPTDVDTALDVYDAHACTASLPCPPPPPPAPPACTGDACQQPATPPNDPTPGSLTFQGAGNLLQCPKGKVKRSGKCAARKHKKAHKRHGKKSHGRTAGHNRGGGK